MSEKNQDDKQYEPTQKKLDDARRKGDIPRSVDLTTAASYGGLVLVATAMGAVSMNGLGTGFVAMLAASSDRQSLGPDLATGILRFVAAETAPWFLGPAAIALLAIIAQRGLVFAPSKLEPKLSRISPISVAKQKFGRSGLFDFFKSFAKLLILSFVLGLYIWIKLPRIIGSLWLEPGPIAAELGRMTLVLLAMVFLIAVVLGVIDAVFQHAEHRRQNRMSRQELMDELKSSEGDPYMKQHRRQRGVEIAMNSMLKDVPKADVVIVNPTHYAVALEWDRSGGGAPKCVAKGVDAIAARIREIAAEHAIPIHSDPPTARALHAGVEIGDEIRPDYYAPVAAAIRFADGVRRKARQRQ